MRQAVLGFVLGAGLLTAVAAFALAPGNSVLAQHARAPAPQDGELNALHWTVVEGSKQLEAVLLVDPQRKAMGVYHIDRASGVITLKSVRQCDGDLQLPFNETRPTAAEIRGMMVHQR
jgi:hypothetical protein